MHLSDFTHKSCLAYYDDMILEIEFEYEPSDEFGYTYGSIEGTHKTHDGFFYATGIEFLAWQTSLEERNEQAGRRYLESDWKVFGQEDASAIDPSFFDDEINEAMKDD